MIYILIYLNLLLDMAL